MYRFEPSQAKSKHPKILSQHAAFELEQVNTEICTSLKCFIEAFETDPNTKKQNLPESPDKSLTQKRRGRSISQVNRMVTKLAQIENYLEEMTILSNQVELLGLLPKIRQHRERYQALFSEFSLQNNVMSIEEPDFLLLKDSQAENLACVFSEGTLGQRIIEPAFIHLVKLYFSTIQVNFPLIDKSKFDLEAKSRPYFLICSICCISSRFSSHPCILASSFGAVTNRLFDMAKYAAASNYSTPTLELAQTFVLLAIHSFGSSNEAAKFSSSAIQTCLQLGVHSKNDHILFGASLGDQANLFNLDRTWVFCLEIDRVTSLFYRRPMMYTADLASGHLVKLPKYVNLYEFSIFTWKLTLALRYLTYHAIKSPHSPKSQASFHTCLNNINTSLVSMENVIDKATSRDLKAMLKTFRSIFYKIAASVHLIYLFPHLYQLRASLGSELTQDKFNQAKSSADVIYDGLPNNLQNNASKVFHMPSTSLYVYLIAGLFYKAAAFSPIQTRNDSTTLSSKQYNIVLTDQLEFHMRYFKVIYFFRALAPYWRFSYVALQILEKN
ncbi:hypothetical protein DSO57_1000962 [Entomophthora muscae]|uniref:Uncharacterized protein n=1 Tax=Entomophthora muscae TaxID=34485 RepID=A0ACC2UIH6_9FUNG|nr:hypothetical protein DSO57_1000962 [Entomophthora muscae]